MLSMSAAFFERQMPSAQQFIDRQNIILKNFYPGMSTLAYDEFTLSIFLSA
jgi:hypothetical protein